jgi:hypothetical protein
MDLSDDDKPCDLFDNDEDAVEIRVNQKYAKEYQSRKQREELLNVRQQGGDEDDESSSSDEEEDEDGTLLSPSVDINILKVPTTYIAFFLLNECLFESIHLSLSLFYHYCRRFMP